MNNTTYNTQRHTHKHKATFGPISKRFCTIRYASYTTVVRVEHMCKYITKTTTHIPHFDFSFFENHFFFFFSASFNVVRFTFCTTGAGLMSVSLLA